MDFRTQPQLVIPENGNVTIQCGGRSLDTYSSQGAMQLLKNSVVGFQDCKLNTFRDFEEAVAQGRRDDAFASIFGNPANGVAQIRNSDVFFPAFVRFIPLSRRSVRFCMPHVCCSGLSARYYTPHLMRAAWAPPARLQWPPVQWQLSSPAVGYQQLPLEPVCRLSQNNSQCDRPV